MSWNRSLQVLKKIFSLVMVTTLTICLVGCSVLDFDKNKNSYITDPTHMEGLLD